MNDCNNIVFYILVGMEIIILLVWFAWFIWALWDIKETEKRNKEFWDEVERRRIGKYE